MLKSYKTLVCFIVLVFACVVVTAQAAPGEPMKQAKVPLGKWWRNPTTVKNLNLTQTEMDTLDAAFDNRARMFIELKHAIELAQFDMDRLMLKDPLDESALMTQFNKLESARSSLSKERFQYYLQVRKLLGADRFQKINTFRKRMHKQDKEMRQQKKKSRQ
jgi:Spy/CpxP family protein refolding chaperone